MRIYNSTCVSYIRLQSANAGYCDKKWKYAGVEEEEEDIWSDDDEVDDDDDFFDDDDDPVDDEENDEEVDEKSAQTPDKTS